jgi:PST family polysaccharide transporter
MGRTDVQMRWAIWSSPFVVAGFVAGLPWGPEGVAASFSVTFSVAFLIFIKMACRVAPVSPSEIWIALRVIFLSAILASFLLLLLKQFVVSINDIPLILRFCITIPAFGIFFLTALCSTLSGREELRRLLNLRNELRGQV